MHAALDLDNIQNWKVNESHSNKVKAITVNEPWNNNIALPPFTIPYVDISTQIRDPTRLRASFSWDKLRTLDTYHRHQSQIFRRGVLRRCNIRSTLQEDLQLNDLNPIQSFSHSPGSITKIEQKEGWVAIGSSVVGGLPDHIDAIRGRNPYNRPGSLIMWNHSVANDPAQYILKGHFFKFGCAGNYDEKNYAIHDIKFDPCNDLLVTSGSDYFVKIWQYDADGFPAGYTGEKLHPVKKFPCLHDLAFKPGTSILAVAERKLHVIYNILNNPSDVTFVVAPAGTRQRHSVGAMAWGANASNNLLFASSEPLEGNESIGYHKAFDIVHQRAVCDFDAREAGDSLALSNSGSTLALTTRNDDNHGNWLRFYDARRHDSRALLTVDLEKFPDDLEGEVNSLAFSPDDIYLALGRNDNKIHVYDSRMNDRLLYKFEHVGASRVAPGCKSYGVTKVQWVHSYSGSRLGLTTGGEDGCIRLWDTLGGVETPDDNVIAEAPSDIAYFSLGDRHKGEQPLIIGDCTGAISIFNCTNIADP
ncbi:WD40-repeat-containing domain protein [Cyathus striatus]|nr:WD40-repeat-containing domain protein [Cyathus striatus]